jgi:hypothetical protein
MRGRSSIILGKRKKVRSFDFAQEDRKKMTPVREASPTEQPPPGLTGNDTISRYGEPALSQFCHPERRSL